MEGVLPRSECGPRLGAPALAVATAALLAGTVFFGGDVRDVSVPWIGGGAVALAAAAFAAGSRGLLELPRLDRPAVAATAALVGIVAWTGISLAWSIAGDLSWAALNKGIAYVGLLAVGLALGSLGTRTTRVAAGLLAGLVGLALLWALAGKAIPALFPDGVRTPRLRNPVGYWNGLALLADAAVALGLWVAVSASRRRGARAAGALLVYAAVLVVALTSSRAGAAGALLALGLWLWLSLSRERLTGALVALAAGLPAAAVAGWAFTRPALVDAGAANAARVHDGAIFGGLALAAAVVAAGAAIAAPARLAPGRERLLARALAAAAAAAVASGLAALALAAGNPFSGAVHQFSRGECVNTPGRLTTLCTNNRLQWWREAWRIFAAHPAGGTGAGTFEIARKRYRSSGDEVAEPHSVPLQVLAGTGVVGGVLLAAFAAGAGVGVARALRRLDGPERAAATALAALPAVYALHALVDYDLDFLAVTGPALVATGALLAAGRPAARVPGGVQPAVAAAVLAAAAAVSLGSPWLAARKVDAATRAIDSGRLGEAVSEATAARNLDPLSLDAVYALAQAAERAGDPVTALARYLQATRLQPENPDPWYQLGYFEFAARRDLCAAYQAFNHAYTLDPRGTEWTKGGYLDQARGAVNHGACQA